MSERDEAQKVMRYDAERIVDEVIQERVDKSIYQLIGKRVKEATESLYDYVDNVVADIKTPNSPRGEVRYFGGSLVHNRQDSSSIDFLESGTAPTYGFATRTAQAKISEGVLSITDFKNQDGTAVSTSVTDNSTGLQSAITYAFNWPGMELTSPPGEFKYATGLTLPNASGAIKIRGLGRPKSFTGGVDSDPTAVQGSQWTYTGTTGDALSSTLTGSKRQYITLENFTIQGNVSGGSSGHCVHWIAAGTTMGILVCYRDFTANGAKQTGIFHDGNVFECQLYNVRGSQNGDRGFKAAANTGGIPGETRLSDCSFDSNAVGVDLTGGGHFSYHGLTCTANTAQGLIANGVKLEGIDLQLEINGTAAGDQATLTTNNAILMGVFMTALTSGTGNGLNFSGTGNTNKVIGFSSNSSVAGAGYQDIRFANTMSFCDVDGYVTDDATNRITLGTGSGNSVRRMNGEDNLILTDNTSGNPPLTLSGKAGSQTLGLRIGTGAKFYLQPVSTVDESLQFQNTGGATVFKLNKNGMLQGLAASNGPVGTVTLAANAATTTVSHTGVTASSIILLFPTTANAAADVGSATGVYISAISASTSFTITHPNNANADKTFNYLVLN